LEMSRVWQVWALYDGVLSVVAGMVTYALNGCWASHQWRIIKRCLHSGDCDLETMVPSLSNCFSHVRSNIQCKRLTLYSRLALVAALAVLHHAADPSMSDTSIQAVSAVFSVLLTTACSPHHVEICLKSCLLPYRNIDPLLLPPSASFFVNRATTHLQDGVQRYRFVASTFCCTPSISAPRHGLRSGCTQTNTCTQTVCIVFRWHRQQIFGNRCRLQHPQDISYARSQWRRPISLLSAR
jgi:hypothetical protein